PLFLSALIHSSAGYVDTVARHDPRDPAIEEEVYVADHLDAPGLPAVPGHYNMNGVFGQTGEFQIQVTQIR
ncbi:MAG TPA: hypothetical protein VIT43_00435, partial [Candidatus Dormibacteraeota bacterium]